MGLYLHDHILYIVLPKHNAQGVITEQNIKKETLNINVNNTCDTTGKHKTYCTTQSHGISCYSHEINLLIRVTQNDFRSNVFLLVVFFVPAPNNNKLEGIKDLKIQMRPFLFLTDVKKTSTLYNLK